MSELEANSVKPFEDRCNADGDYNQLKGLAQSLLRNESLCTLTATGLVHELFLKARRHNGGASRNSSTQTAFPPFAGRMMRQILIDRARSRATRRKAEGHAMTLHGDDEVQIHNMKSRLIELDDLIGKLAVHLPVNAELVRLHLYEERSIESAARQLNLSRAGAYRKWDFSKAWLVKQLQK